MINIDLTNAVDAGEIFFLKSALGAGCIAFGDQFPASDLAQRLREWLHAPFDNPLIPGAQRERIYVEALARFDQLFHDTNKQFVTLNEPAVLPMLHRTLDDRTCDIVFIPLGNRTAVFGHILGIPVTPYGVVLDARLQSPGVGGDAAGPVLVREECRQVTVTDFTEVMLRGVAAAAQEALED